jgi:hypothetical protein
MQLHRFEDPQAFYDRVEPFLLAHEAENNLPLGLVGALIEDLHRYGDDPPYMALVEEDGQVVHVALRTPPFNAIMAMTDDLEAVKRVAQDVYEVYRDQLPGVNGPSEVSIAFAEHWQTLTGQTYHRPDLSQKPVHAYLPAGCGQPACRGARPVAPHQRGGSGLDSGVDQSL